MYLPEFPTNNSFSNRSSSKQAKTKSHLPKPHLPADPVGKRYVKYFWHPFKAIIAPLTGAKAGRTASGEKPAWYTENHYLQPSQLWELHQNEEKLVGIRFGETTNFAVIDLDNGGDYHNDESIKQIKYALEDIGIVDIIPIQSSYSGGYHLIITFSSPQRTFDLACALETTLKDAGFVIRQGHLEIFPNAKPYSAKTITNFNAIRCPMQPGSGALLLGDDLEPISDNVSTFLDFCSRSARQQDLTKLKRVAKKARERITKERRRSKATVSVENWRCEWEKIIATGWTGFGQTNTYLQVVVGYGIVFLGLKYSELVKYAVETATNAPGYTEYCRHQQEIEARVREWVSCTIDNKWYSPYASQPERPKGTFAATFRDGSGTRCAVPSPLSPVPDPFPHRGGVDPVKLRSENKVISLDRRKAENARRSREAQRRIRWVVQALEWDSGLDEGITSRMRAITSEYKRQFNKTISKDTLRKYRHLWHPNFYISDPWVENSQNPDEMGRNGHFEPQADLEKNQNSQNPDEISRYGHFPYMKVLKLLPGAVGEREEFDGQQTADGTSSVSRIENNLNSDAPDLISNSPSFEIVDKQDFNSDLSQEHSTSVQSANHKNQSVSYENQLINHENQSANHKKNLTIQKFGNQTSGYNQNLSFADVNGLGDADDTCLLGGTPGYGEPNCGEPNYGEPNCGDSDVQPDIGETQCFASESLVPTLVPPVQADIPESESVSPIDDEPKAFTVLEYRQAIRLRLKLLKQARVNVRNQCILQNITPLPQVKRAMEAEEFKRLMLSSDSRILRAEAQRNE